MPGPFCAHLTKYQYWLGPTSPAHMSLLPGQVRVFRDMPGAQLIHVDVSLAQLLPTALQQETKVAAPPTACFLPMST